MADNDYAVVIGINEYRRLGERGQLRAPLFDAIRFTSWLLDPAGGAVPWNNIQLLLQPLPSPEDIQSLLPSLEDIQSLLKRQFSLAKRAGLEEIIKVFRDFYDLGEKCWWESLRTAMGYRLGRRFYLFLAGHGFEGSPEDKYVALLTPDGDYGPMADDHLPALVYARSIYLLGHFEEVILFMDTCREPCLLRRQKGYFNVTPPGDRGAGQKFFALGARPFQKSREVPLLQTDDATGKKIQTYAGQFSTFVLDGLKGQARLYDPNKKITGKALATHIRKRYELVSRAMPGKAVKDLAKADLEEIDPDLVFFGPGSAPPPPDRFNVLVTREGGTPMPNLDLVLPDGMTIYQGVSNVERYRLSESAFWIEGLEIASHLLRSPDGNLEKGFDVIAGGVIDESSQSLPDVRVELYDPASRLVRWEDT